jgi:ribulose-phosphate 3-epimerase
MNYEIIPAIMPEKFEDIESWVATIRHEVQTVQLDIMDGKYVPEKTWPFMYDSDYRLRDMKKEDAGFPFWEDINYELDLMVQRPEERLEDWFATGASRIIFHFGSVHDWNKIYDIDPVMRDFVEVFLAVTIHDDFEEVQRVLSLGSFDGIQVMGIEQIGYQGEPFTPLALDAILRVKESFPGMVIAVDGAVNRETIQDLQDAGANHFIAGSAIFEQGIASENIEYLYSLLKNDA